MKKLLAALIITLGTAAVAQSDDKDMNTQAQQEQKRNEGRKISTGVDAAEVDDKISEAGKKVVGVGKKAEQKAEEVVGIDSAKDGTFKKEKAFSMMGTFKGKAIDGVTLARQGLPDADLDVRKETQVMLDGKKVELAAIPEGAQVRARFQLEGQEIVALELKATSPKAGSTKKTMKKDTQAAPVEEPVTEPTQNQ
ncbi:MAG TPA: hypothetical protein VF794_32650 [Archangium sp.]|jgi:hypothetical protein|uniref:hypothetical protein n=1 Tax=Archangium sp. TaxID=1872627 RepID=UPI002EDAB864